MAPMHKWVFGAVAVAFFLAPAAIFFAAQEAEGTSLEMQVLPAYEKYRCAVCHTSASPNNLTGRELNVFGEDFKKNGGVWNETLALQNSDGDRCSNGFELGDRDGDGVFDNPGGQLLENSNPADASDCTVPVDPRTWGIIKSIFRGEMRELSEGMDAGLWEQVLAYYP